LLTRIIVFLSLFVAATTLRAQAIPAGSRVGDLKIGGGFSIANSDYYHQFNGGAGYFNYDFLAHFGLEGEFHFVQGAAGLYEKTYEVGGRYYRTYGKFVPYAKIMYGRGVFNFQPEGPFQSNLAYNLAAGGLGVDYKVKPWLYARIDGEYQNWFGFQNSSLSPSILTIGAAYRFK
jgi:Outer membrane protein beta-barrel domain